MATTQPGDSGSVEAVDTEVAQTIERADFLHLVVTADADAIAAAGIIGRLLHQAGTAYQVSAVDTHRAASHRIADADTNATTVTLGVADSEASAAITGRPASAVAYQLAAEYGQPGPESALLTLAGCFTTGVPSDAVDDALEHLRSSGGAREPGIATTGTGVAEALTYTTIGHSSVSGNPAEAEAVIDDLDLEEPVGGRSLASWLTLDISDHAPSAASDDTAISRCVAPLVVDHEFGTVEGYGDVLQAAAAINPSAGIALALGHGHASTLRDVWRRHGRAVHDAVRSSDRRRYDGVEIVDVDAPVRATARLLRDYVAMEPTVVVLGADHTAVATTDSDATTLLEHVTDETMVSGWPSMGMTPQCLDDTQLETLRGECR